MLSPCKEHTANSVSIADLKSLRASLYEIEHIKLWMNQYQKQSSISIAFSFCIASRGKSPFPTPFLFMDTFKIRFQAFWLFIRSELTQPCSCDCAGRRRRTFRSPAAATRSCFPSACSWQSKSVWGWWKRKGFLVSFTGLLFVKNVSLDQSHDRPLKDKVP